MQDLWVFGYGSLMWRPGFAYEEAVPALLRGAHRSLCVYSWVHRGTEQRPGLVLGLDRGGACRGVAFRVSGRNREKTISYLREREQATMVYREAERPLKLQDGAASTVTALAYLVDRTHPQYAGVLTRERQLALVRGAVGQSGANPDYVLNTTRHLNELGIHDPLLSWLAAELTAEAVESVQTGCDRRQMQQKII